MGAKQSGPTNNTKLPPSPRDALKNRAQKIGKIAHANSDVHIARAWSNARFASLTNFVHDEKDGATLSEDDFTDPLVALLFGFIATKRLQITGPLNKKQFVDAMVLIAKYTEQQMVDFISEALVFMFNQRTNRLHPNNIDASTIRGLINILPADYNLEEVTSTEITSFFEQETGKKSGCLASAEAARMIHSSVQPAIDLKLIHPFKKPTRAPHLHPSPKDKGWTEVPFGHDSGDDTDSDEDAETTEEGNVVGNVVGATTSTTTMFTVTFVLGSLGMTLNTKENEPGCFVTSVRPNSQAAKATIEKGHQLVKIDGISVTNSTDAMELLKSKPRPVKVVFGKKSAAVASSPTTPAVVAEEQKQEDVETVQKKVLIMKKIRNKKLEMTQADDPNEKQDLKKELRVLVKRLQAVEGFKTRGVAPTPAKPTAAASFAGVVKEEELETYTMTVKEGRIGLGLVASGADGSTNGVTVSKISPGTQAAQCEDMAVGDILLELGSVDVRAKTMREVMALLQTTQRPFVLTFQLGEDDEDSD